MRKTNIIGLIAVMVCVAAIQVKSQNYHIVPGKSVGPITADTSEIELIKIYGGQNVRRINVDVGEGETQPGTVVFPNDAGRKILILWSDGAMYQRPESVIVRGKNTLWKTDRGITLGTTLRTIEDLNGKPFALTGFGWDYSGTVLHANGGKLVELGSEAGEDIVGRTLLLRLEPSKTLQKTAEYQAAQGDEKFFSDHHAMKKLNPMVYEMVVTFAASAQTDAEIEKELVTGIKNIQKYTIYGGSYDEEKLTTAQNNFQQKLVSYTKSASTLNYGFQELDDHMTIATSDDGRLRSYSWDLEDGGTMHRFGQLFQYLGTDETIYSKPVENSEEGMGNGFVTDIFTLDTHTGPVYVVCSTFIGSTKDYFQTAELYRIEGSALNGKVKMFKTTSGLTNKIGFEYDNFSIIDREPRREKLITFDKKTKTLKIPVVIKDKEYPEGRVTDRSIYYRFDGTYFVKVT